MGNQLGLRTQLMQPPHSVICDQRSHLFNDEAGMTSILSQAQLIPIMADLSKRAYLILEDIAPRIVPDNGDVHTAPTRVIALENTIWGKIVPPEELRRIFDYAHERGIKVHLDGARLWNACYPQSTYDSTSEEAANTARSLLQDYCSLCDTVTLCFSKSLGAPCGSILLSNDASTIARARHFRKALGGGMRQTGILAAPARVAVDDIFLSGVELPKANARAKDLQTYWKSLGGQTQAGVGQETNIIWLDLDSSGIEIGDFKRIGREEGVKLNHRLVVHHRKSDLSHGYHSLSRFLRLLHLMPGPSVRPYRFAG